MKDYVIALDSGKHTIKATGREVTPSNEEKEIKRVSFRARSYDLRNSYLEVAGNSHKVLFNGDENGIIVGEQGTDADFNTSKTNELHRLCAYTAITQFLEPNTKDNKIHLVLACPLDVLKIKEAKEEYKNFIKGDEPITINIDDEDYTFEIVDIIIKAEGSGIVYTQPEYFEDKNTAVVDLGGLNLSFSSYKNKVNSAENRFSEELGGNKLTEYVRDSLKVYRKGNDVKIEEAEKALKDGHLYKLGEPEYDSSTYIVKAKEKYVENLISCLARRGQKLDTFQEVVFIGGTTKRVEGQLLNKYKNARIPGNPQWESVDGLYKVAFARYIKTTK